MSINKDLGPLPKVHPRDVTEQKAGLELLSFVIDWQKRHELTFAEAIYLLAFETQRMLAACVKAERREESRGEANRR